MFSFIVDIVSDMKKQTKINYRKEMRRIIISVGKEVHLWYELPFLTSSVLILRFMLSGEWDSFH